MLRVSGYLDITAPRGLTIDDVLKALDLGSIADVPLIGEVATTAVNSAHLTLEAEEKGTKTETKLTGYKFEFSRDKLPDLGPVKLVDVNVSVESSTLIVTDKPKQNVKTFTFSALSASRSWELAASYSSQSGLLTASFRAVKAVSVAGAIEDFIGKGDLAQGFRDIIHDLGVSTAFVEFDVKDKMKPKAFSLYLQDDTTVEVHGVWLTSLRIDYIAQRSDDKGVSISDSIFNLVGTTSGTNVSAVFRLRCLWNGKDNKVNTIVEASIEPLTPHSLKLSGLLQLLYPGEKKLELSMPADLKDPNFFDLDITKVAGAVEFAASKTDPTKKTARLKTLDVVVHSTGKLDIGLFTLQSFSLILHREAQAQQTMIVALLKIPDKVLVPLYYRKETKDNKAIQHFEGALDSIDPNAKLDYQALAATYLEPNSYALPQNDSPPAVVMRNVEVSYITGEKFEVWGKGSNVNWPVKLFGYEITVTDLGGRLVRYLGKEGGYEATLYGGLKFDDFTSLKAVLQLGKQAAGKDKPKIARNILFATLKRDATGPYEVSKLIDGCAKNTKPVKDVLPPSTKSLALSKINAQLILDFSSSTFFFIGEIEGIGSTLVLVRKGEDSKYSYLFYIQLSNIRALWPELDDTLDKWFTFKELTVQVTSREILLSKLKEETAVVETVAIEDEETKKRSSAVSVSLTRLTEEVKIPAGVNINATIAFDRASPITSVLGLCAQEGPAPQLFLSGEIPDRQLSNGKYSITITDFNIFSGALVIKKAKGTYAPATHTIKIDADLQLTLEGNPEPNKFSISYTVDSKQYSFALKAPEPTTGAGAPAEPAKVIKNPFSGMFGIDIGVKSFTGVVPKPEQATDDNNRKSLAKSKSSFILAGEVTLGSIKLTGNLLFVGGTPKLISLKADKEVSVVKVFSDIILAPRGQAAPPGTEWPSSYDDISLTDVVFYYTKETNLVVPDDKTQYRPGFNIIAKVEFFGKQFIVTASLPADRSGISIDAVYSGEIPADFMKLTGRKLKEAEKIDGKTSSKGPRAIIKSCKVNNVKQQTYIIDTGLEFFGQPDFYVELSYKTQGKKFTGKAGYDHTLEILGAKIDPSVSVTYKDKHWSFSGFKAEKLLDIDIKKALEEGSKIDRPDCKKLVNLILKESITTTFHWTIDFDRKEGDSVFLKVTGTFSLVVQVPLFKTKVGSVDLDIPTLVLVPIKNFKLDTLITLLGDTMKNAVADIGKAILSNPEKATIIFGYLTVENWAAETITALLCRDIRPDNVFRRLPKLVPSDDHDPENKPDKFWDNFLEKVAWAAVIAAGVGLLVAFGPELAAAAELFAGFEASSKLAIPLLEKAIATMTRAGLTAAAGYTLAELMSTKTKIETTLNNASLRLKEGRSKMRIALNLTKAPKANFVPKSGALQLDWKDAIPLHKPKEGETPVPFTRDVRPNTFKWQIVVSTTDTAPPKDGEPPSKGLYETTNSSLQIHAPEYTSAPSVYVWVRGRYGDDKITFSSEKWTAAVVATQTPKLPMLPSVKLSVDSAAQNLITDVPGAAKGTYVYQLSLTPSDMVPTAKDIIYGPDTKDNSYRDGHPSLSIGLRQLDWLKARSHDGTRNLQASVYQKSIEVGKSDSGRTWSNLLPTIPAPHDLDVTYANGQLQAKWKARREAEFHFIVASNAGVALYEVNTKQVEITVPVAGTQLEGKGEVDVFVSEVPPQGKQIVALLARSSATLLTVPAVTVTNGSYYDLPSKELFLTLKLTPAPSSFSDLGQFVIFPEATGGDSASPIYTDEFDDRQSDSNDQVLVILDDKKLPSPLPKSLRLSVLNSENVQGPLSTKWELPALPAALPATTATIASDPANKSLIVSWLALPDAVTHIHVVLLAEENESMTGARVARTVSAKDMSTTFKKPEFRYLAGQKVSVVMTSWSGTTVKGLESKTAQQTLLE